MFDDILSGQEVVTRNAFICQMACIRRLCSTHRMTFAACPSRYEAVWSTVKTVPQTPEQMQGRMCPGAGTAVCQTRTSHRHTHFTAWQHCLLELTPRPRLAKVDKPHLTEGDKQCMGPQLLFQGTSHLRESDAESKSCVYQLLR